MCRFAKTHCKVKLELTADDPIIPLSPLTPLGISIEIIFFLNYLICQQFVFQFRIPLCLNQSQKYNQLLGWIYLENLKNLFNFLSFFSFYLINNIFNFFFG